MVTYRRNPTQSEIRFGYGCQHFVDIPLSECLNKSGKPKKRIQHNGKCWYLV